MNLDQRFIEACQEHSVGKTFFSANGTGKQDPYLRPCTKINSEWIHALTVKSTTYKKTYCKICMTLELGNNFLGNKRKKNRQIGLYESENIVWMKRRY